MGGGVVGDWWCEEVVVGGSGKLGVQKGCRGLIVVADEGFFR